MSKVGIFPLFSIISVDFVSGVQRWISWPVWKFKTHSGSLPPTTSRPSPPPRPLSKGRPARTFRSSPLDAGAHVTRVQFQGHVEEDALFSYITDLIDGCIFVRWLLIKAKKSAFIYVGTLTCIGLKGPHACLLNMRSLRYWQEYREGKTLDAARQADRMQGEREVNYLL